MKKTDLVNLFIFFMALIGTSYYAYQFYVTPINAEDPREKEYLSMEIKRNQLNHAVRYTKEKQYEEALLILEQNGINDNPYGIFLKGYILFNIGKKEEGLLLIKNAIQSSKVLYDPGYPNNVRSDLEEVLSNISKDTKLKEYRHFIESKLKGGCG